MKFRKYGIYCATLAVAVVFSAIPFKLVKADEGMFMLDTIAKLPLKKMGLKIPASDIYNPNGGGLSEAVVSLSIGCTGEFVSAEGLILTNHHCAIDGLVAASTVAANYGEIGYKADNRETELPAKDYSVDITLKSEDVTAQVLNGLSSTDTPAIQKRLAELTKAEQAKAAEGVTVVIQPLSAGLFYYKFDYATIEDIRIAYAPPYSVGQFGGDPDNFEWTRHGGDFTFMRAYVGKDGKPAPYSKDNVPYKPKKFLSISNEGLKDNDFTMIMGFPGGTNRYRESFSVAYNQDYQIPFGVDNLRARAEALEMVGRTSAAKKVALQSDIFGLYNSLKAQEGGLLAMKRANIVRQKQAQEAAYSEWIAKDPTRAKYGDAMKALKDVYANYSKTAPQDIVLRGMLSVDILGFIYQLSSGQVPKERLKGFIPRITGGEPIAARENFKFMLRKAADLPDDQKIAVIEKLFTGLKGDARITAEDEFARKMFENAPILTEKGLTDLLAMTPEQMKSSTEPLIMLVNELQPTIAGAFARQAQLSGVIAPNRITYMQGMVAMKGTTPYPDANFTQRFTYGYVKGYKPREAEMRFPFTTLDGVFEKETGRDPFKNPAKLRSLWESKDYGSYGVNGTMPVDFLTTHDIIGGNSGSPVLNAKGEQVGIAFDGNYEGLGNDFFFNPDLGRTISVDIRYVMFITDKFGGAGWILKELDVKNGKSMSKKAGK
jgi:Peptidase S46